MATTNLTEKTLGGILLSTGNGVPNHTAPQGSLYTDEDTAADYINNDGGTTWIALVTAAYGEVYRTATSTVSPATTGYTELTTNFALRAGEGVSIVGGRVSVDTGYDGTYAVLLTTSLAYVATDATHTVGISKNSATPLAGSLNATTVSSTRNTGNTTSYATIALVGGDEISSMIQASVAGNVDIDYQTIIIWKKAE